MIFNGKKLYRSANFLFLFRISIVAIATYQFIGRSTYLNDIEFVRNAFVFIQLRTHSDGFTVITLYKVSYNGDNGTYRSACNEDVKHDFPTIIIGNQT